MKAPSSPLVGIMIIFAIALLLVMSLPRPEEVKARYVGPIEPLPTTSEEVSQ